MFVKKICLKCKKAKILFAFFVDKSSPDKKCSTCKKCCHDIRKEYYRENMEAEKLRSKRYYLENKESIIGHKREYYRKNRKRILEAIKMAKKIRPSQVKFKK